MKIALIHYRLILLGGLETRLLNYSHDLHHLGHKVTVIYAKRSDDIQLPEGIKEIKLSPGMMPKPWRAQYFNFLLGQYMKTHQFDLSLSLGRTSHQDMVLCPGNHLGYLNAIGKKPSSLSDNRQIKMDRMAYKHSRLILAASEMMKRELMQFYGVNESKIRVLYPPLNIEKFNISLKSQQNALKSKYGFSSKKRTFLFVSASHSRKGLPLLLEVFKELDSNKFELIIAGTSHQSNLSNVKYIGFVKDLPGIYAACDMTLHPSIYEPYGQIIAESIACGTPVMLSDQTGASEIVGQQEGIIMDNLEPNKWLSQIKSLDFSRFNISGNYAADKKITLKDHIDHILNASDK